MNFGSRDKMPAILGGSLSLRRNEVNLNLISFPSTKQLPEHSNKLAWYIVLSLCCLGNIIAFAMMAECCPRVVDAPDFSNFSSQSQWQSQSGQQLPKLRLLKSAKKLYNPSTTSTCTTNTSTFGDFNSMKKSTPYISKSNLKSQLIKLKANKSILPQNPTTTIPPSKDISMPKKILNSCRKNFEGKIANKKSKSSTVKEAQQKKNEPQVQKILKRSVEPNLILRPIVSITECSAPRSQNSGQNQNQSRRKSVERMQVIRSEEEKLKNPDKINLDNCNLSKFPLFGPGECHQQFKLISLQHNSLVKMENLPALNQLVCLDLYDNRLEKISGINPLVSLRVLLLGKNRIHRIEGLDNLKRLEVLDLHGNQLRYVDNLGSLTSLRVLNLAGNLIRSVRNLGPVGLPSLVELNLKRNRIRNLEGLYKAPHLKKVLLGNNDLTSYSHLISALKKLLFLQELQLDPNPLLEISEESQNHEEKFQNYDPGQNTSTTIQDPSDQMENARNQILSSISWLEILDSVQITEQMRSQAKVWKRQKIHQDEERRKFEQEKLKLSKSTPNLNAKNSREEIIHEARRRWESLKNFVVHQNVKNDMICDQKSQKVNLTKCSSQTDTEKVDQISEKVGKNGEKFGQNDEQENFGQNGKPEVTRIDENVTVVEQENGKNCEKVVNIIPEMGHFDQNGIKNCETMTEKSVKIDKLSGNDYNGEVDDHIISNIGQEQEQEQKVDKFGPEMIDGLKNQNKNTISVEEMPILGEMTDLTATHSHSQCHKLNQGQSINLKVDEIEEMDQNDEKLIAKESQSTINTSSSTTNSNCEEIGFLTMTKSSPKKSKSFTNLTKIAVVRPLPRSIEDFKSQDVQINSVFDTRNDEILLKSLDFEPKNGNSSAKNLILEGKNENIESKNGNFESESQNFETNIQESSSVSNDLGLEPNFGQVEPKSQKVEPNVSKLGSKSAKTSDLESKTPTVFETVLSLSVKLEKFESETETESKSLNSSIKCKLGGENGLIIESLTDLQQVLRVSEKVTDFAKTGLQNANQNEPASLNANFSQKVPCENVPTAAGDKSFKKSISTSNSTDSASTSTSISISTTGNSSRTSSISCENLHNLQNLQMTTTTAEASSENSTSTNNNCTTDNDKGSSSKKLRILRRSASIDQDSQNLEKNLGKKLLGSLGRFKSASFDFNKSDSSSSTDSDSSEFSETQSSLSALTSPRKHNPFFRSRSRSKRSLSSKQSTCTVVSSGLNSVLNRSTRPLTTGHSIGQKSGSDGWKKSLKRSDSSATLLSSDGALPALPLRKQGPDYLVEIEGKTLNIYGQGALKHTLMGFPSSVTSTLLCAKFNYVSYEGIIPYFGKLRQIYPALENFYFRANNLSILGQLNALADLQGITGLHVSREGNPLTENELWPAYAQYRLGHWGLQSVNGKIVGSENGKIFESLGYLALSCLPQSALTPLAKKLHTLQCFCCCSSQNSAPSTSGTSDESSGRKKDGIAEICGGDRVCEDDPVLLEVIGKEALVYNPPILPQTSVNQEQNEVFQDQIQELITRDRNTIPVQIINSGCEILEKLEMLDKIWAKNLQEEMISEILMDFMFMDSYMKRDLKKLRDLAVITINSSSSTKKY